MSDAVAVPERGGAYTYRGRVAWDYRPELDRDADPGEIVWSWVSYEEDASVGKDRPIAVLGHADDGRLAAVMLSSQDHRGDRGWFCIGSGPWDDRGRESWVRTDRVLAVRATSVRREGAVLPPEVYRSVAAAMGATLVPSGPRRSLFGRLRRLLKSR